MPHHVGLYSKYNNGGTSSSEVTIIVAVGVADTVGVLVNLAEVVMESNKQVTHSAR